MEIYQIYILGGGCNHYTGGDAESFQNGSYPRGQWGLGAVRQQYSRCGGGARRCGHNVGNCETPAFLKKSGHAKKILKNNYALDLNSGILYDSIKQDRQCPRNSRRCAISSSKSGATPGAKKDFGDIAYGLPDRP